MFQSIQRRGWGTSGGDTPLLGLGVTPSRESTATRALSSDRSCKNEKFFIYFSMRYV
jgi:hypothetical protein